MERKAFLDQDPPLGYVAGIGRGATGFTTRSDVGNSRLPPQQQLRDNSIEDDENFQDVAEGLVEGEGGLLSFVGGNKDDEEADKIYQEIDERLKLRNYKRKIPIDEVKQIETNLVNISNQFVDLKQNLSSISETEWLNLPEVGDLTKRNKRLRKLEQESRRTYVAPDSLLAGLGQNAELESSVDLEALTSERQKLLASKIDANFDWNDENVDSASYLNEISNLSQNSEEEVKKVRTILSSFTKADPKKPEGWIARARLEEFNKKFDNAKKIIQQGCSNCPLDEGIWLENVRLNQHDLKVSKIIIAEAVKLNLNSLKLWLKAIDLEQEIFNKKRVLRKALEQIPESAELWIKSIDLEDNNEDKIKIATKACEIVPESEDLWLKLINLQPYEDAKKTLNKARKAIEKNVNIWLAACRLEAINVPNSEKINKLVEKTLKECEYVTREEWFSKAIEFEDEGLQFLATVFVDSLMGLESANYAKWSEDADSYQTHIYVYKAILNHIIRKYPKKTVIWRKIIDLYKNNFQREELYSVFENVIEILPKNAIFWLMYSKEVWKDGDIDNAKKILQRAFLIIEINTDIWLAIIKLETVEKNFKRVRQLYQDAITKVDNERVWYKYVTFLRSQNLREDAIETIDQGLNKYPQCWKLYLQKSQILVEADNFINARETLSIGVKTVPKSIELWKFLSHVDYKLGNITRARSDLDLGFLKNPESDVLWLAKLQLEKLSQNVEQVPVILTKALQLFPHSSYLWAFNLKFNTKKSLRKTLYQDALNATKNHARVLIIIGNNFWVDGKSDKAKRWFERAILADEDFGDAWAWYYKFLNKTSHLHNNDELDTFIKKFSTVEPRHGDLWPIVSKEIENIDKEPLEVLKLVASKLTQE